MKTSYKLIGLFWDHRPESESPLDTVPFDPLFLESGHPYCLFDSDAKRRRIPLTRLLALKSQQEAAELTNALIDCASIAVIRDFEPMTQGMVPQSFYRHRLSQAMRLLEDALPGVSIVLMDPPNLEVAA